MKHKNRPRLIPQVILLLTAVAAVAIAQTPDTEWYTANPKADTFWIANADGLAGLARIVNSGENVFRGKTVALTGDINLSSYGAGSAFNGGKGWVPIGSYRHNSADAHPFRGVFDGGGKTVKGLYINDTANDRHFESFGLFGAINGGEVKNLGVVDVDIRGGKRGYAGGVVGYILPRSSMVNTDGGGGRVSNCYVTGTVKNGVTVGGVAGNALGGSVTGCYFIGTVSGNRTIGGVAGLSGVVANSYSAGAVSGNSFVGGVVGHIYNGNTLADCYSVATVSGGDRIGGIAGRIDHNSSVKNCYSAGAVSGYEYVGGIVGEIMSSSELPVSVSSCAALNPSVVLNASEYVSQNGINTGGRVAGYMYHSIIKEHVFKQVVIRDCRAGGDAGGGNNLRLDSLLAFDAMVTARLDTNCVGMNAKNGAGITVNKIHADGTIGGLFTDKAVWTVKPGKLPGLFGQTVDMPNHLRKR